MSCKNDIDETTIDLNIQNLEIKLIYPENSSTTEHKNVKITLTDTYGTIFESVTDNNGTAIFNIPAGIYSASVSEKVSFSKVYNGQSPTIIVTNNAANYSEIKLVEANTNPIIIKELYCGGCQMDDGSGYTRNDKYTTIYNNSADIVKIKNFSLAVAMPYNATGTNANYVNNKLIYAQDEFIPAAMGIWYYPDTLTFKPYEQKTISIFGAIDYTLTYSNSVNLANENYYVLYDQECDRYAGNTQYYPAPYSGIPSSHYLKTVVFGLGTSWVFSVTSPCFFIYYTDENPVDFCNDEQNHYFDGNKSGSWGAYGSCLKVPTANILDAIEVFTTRYDDNKKRLTEDIDAGYVWHTNQNGYTLYRNVNRQATEALEENNGKIVYGYNLGTEDIEKGSTDPSGIDAEASIKNGAHIIYMDTNNSEQDFHQRKKAAIKD